VIVGGMGSFWGAVVGGLIIGVCQSLVVIWWAPAASVIGYVILAVVLLIRPRGIFGVEGILE
jgi:branched-chain amino acid transport system permease protein